MERFSVVVLAFVISLSSIVAICYAQYLDSKKLVLTERANYTSSCGFSLSGEKASVVNVYRNTDYTKTFVLIKFEGDAKFDASASQLSMFMTNASGDEFEGSPTGGIYVFGITEHGNYVGLYFANASGFKSQLYDITIRDARQDPKSYKAYGQYVEGMADQSDAYYNQMHIRTNFGGTAGVVVDFLEEETISVLDAYNATVLHDKYEAVKVELDNCIKRMGDEINNIAKYSEKLDSYGVRVPSLPNCIAGDSVTTDVNKTLSNPMFFSENMLNQGSGIIMNNYNTISSSSKVESATSIAADDKLYFVTDFVYPGGIQFNHQDVKSTDNLLHKIVGKGKYNDFILKLGNQEINYKDLVKFDNKKAYKTWYYENGAAFVPNDADAASKTIKLFIDEYVKSVNSLIEIKQDYQYKKLIELFKLEASTETVAKVTSINSNALTIY